ncbi:MAG: hypothetical protein KAR83_03345 [Thermodesulfovibrionales bacterium]|nr:hypothetical protein [Thermodesulfovibrionales bacterium]
MFNKALLVFEFIDGVLGTVLPLVFRIGLWGVIGGALSMGFYAFLSPQKKIISIKDEMKVLRADLRNAGDDFQETMDITRKNLALSLKLLGTVIGPSLLSALPVIFIVLWLGVYHTYQPPQAGEQMVITPVPAPEAMVVKLGGIEAMRDGDRFLATYVNDGPLNVEAEGVQVYSGRPWSPAVASIGKRSFWSTFLENEGGYLAQDSTIDSLHMELPYKEIISGGPSWVRSWMFTYFLILSIVALAIKFVFKVH